MAQTPPEYLDEAVKQFTVAFRQAAVTRHEGRPDRVLLEMWGWWGEHGRDKATLKLSDEMTCSDLIAWVRGHIPLES